MATESRVTKRRARLKSLGLCIFCGGPLETQVMCAKHAKINRAYSEAKRREVSRIKLLITAQNTDESGWIRIALPPILFAKMLQMVREFDDREGGASPDLLALRALWEEM